MPYSAGDCRRDVLRKAPYRVYVAYIPCILKISHCPLPISLNAPRKLIFVLQLKSKDGQLSKRHLNISMLRTHLNISMLRTHLNMSMLRTHLNISMLRTQDKLFTDRSYMFYCPISRAPYRYPIRAPFRYPIRATYRYPIRDPINTQSEPPIDTQS